MGEHQRAVDKVAQNGHKLGIVLQLEILPCEIVVLGFGGIAAQCVPEYILLAGEFFQIFVQPHSPVAGGADFVALKVEELVGWNIGGEDVAAVGMEHGGEDDAVEDDIVFANEMHQFGLLVLPPLLPVVAFQLFGEGYVTYRGIEPYIQYLAVVTLDGDFDTPVEVAGYGTGLQTSINPGLALAIHIGLPVAFVLLQNPLAQPRFILVQGQIPMLGFPHHGRVAAESRLGVDEVGGVERSAAGFALVAVGMLVAAMRAGTGDVAVGEELPGLFVIVLLRHLLDEFAFVV